MNTARRVSCLLTATVGEEEVEGGLGEGVRSWEEKEEAEEADLEKDLPFSPSVGGEGWSEAIRISRNSATQTTVEGANHKRRSVIRHQTKASSFSSGLPAATCTTQA